MGCASSTSKLVLLLIDIPHYVAAESDLRGSTLVFQTLVILVSRIFLLPECNWWLILSASIGTFSPFAPGKHKVHSKSTRYPVSDLAALIQRVRLPSLQGPASKEMLLLLDVYPLDLGLPTSKLPSFHGRTKSGIVLCTMLLPSSTRQNAD